MSFNRPYHNRSHLMEQSGDITFWIPSERLGVLEAQVQALMTVQLKRHRNRDFLRVCRILHDLRIVDRALQITALALGTSYGGETGLLINCSTPVKLLESPPKAGGES
jgi:hypothetical protein